MRTICQRFTKVMVSLLFVNISVAAPVAQDRNNHARQSQAQSPNLRVQCDLPCIVSIDGQRGRLLSPQKDLRLHVAKGSHEVKALTFDGKDFWQGRVAIGTRSALVAVPLTAERAARKSRELELESLRQQIKTKQDEKSSLQIQVVKLHEADEKMMQQQRKTDEV